ncbi:MAG: START domain-containing protein [Spirochaetia bacterium]|nr:START domain-containing protein [Spirochaetia bacterium]
MKIFKVMKYNAITGITCFFITAFMPVQKSIHLMAAPLNIPEKSELKFVDKKNKILMYTREMKNTNLLAVKAVTVIDAGIFKVAELLRDIDAQKQWRTQAANSSLIEKINDQHLIIFNELELPWPLKNRYFFLEAVVTVFTDQGQAVIDINSLDRKFSDYENITGIRLNNIHARIKLQYISENKTGITYELIADPEGSLPHLIVNFFNKKYLYLDLYNLKKLAQDPKYEIAAINSAEYKMIYEHTKDPALIKNVIRSKLIEFSGNPWKVDFLMKNKKFVDIIYKLRGEIGEMAYLGEGDTLSSIDITKLVIGSYLKEYDVPDYDIYKIQNDAEFNSILRDEKSKKYITKNRIENIIFKYYQPENPSWKRLKDDIIYFYLKEYGISDAEIQKIQYETSLNVIVRKEKTNKIQNNLENIILNHYQENDPSWVRLKNDMIFYFLKDFGIPESDIFKIQNDTELNNIIYDKKFGKDISKSRIENIINRYHLGQSAAWEHFKEYLATVDRP